MKFNNFLACLFIIIGILFIIHGAYKYGYAIKTTYILTEKIRAVKPNSIGDEAFNMTMNITNEKILATPIITYIFPGLVLMILGLILQYLMIFVNSIQKILQDGENLLSEFSETEDQIELK